jgi:phosphosulfolactate synthase
MMNHVGDSHTTQYLRKLGVTVVPPRTSPFDPGYDPVTLEAHLEQSAHRMATLKLSMACWIVADEAVTRRKIAAARRHGVPTVAGGGPFEVAVAQHRLPDYLDLCADIGFTRIECGQGFTTIAIDATSIVKMARDHGLDVQFELGSKHGGAFNADVVDTLTDQGRRWLDAGASELVIEARESAQAVGLFDAQGRFNARLADRLAQALGLERMVFETPTKASQFALLDYFGQDVRLCNVRLEELLRVEIYRLGLHADSFSKANLRPAAPDPALEHTRADQWPVSAP